MVTQGLKTDIKKFVEEYDAERARIFQAFERARIFPEAYKIFRELAACTMKSGALSKKVKELIGVGIAVANGCDTCIMLHVNNALKCGATPEEISEAASVAVYMGGGEAVAHIPIALRAVEELKKK